MSLLGKMLIIHEMEQFVLFVNGQTDVSKHWQVWCQFNSYWWIILVCCIWFWQTKSYSFQFSGNKAKTVVNATRILSACLNRSYASSYYELLTLSTYAHCRGLNQLLIFYFLFLCVQLSHVAVWGSIATWFIFLAIYPHMWPSVDLAPEMVGMVRGVERLSSKPRYRIYIFNLIL